MTLTRVPSFSSRPGFPQGLKVLLVEEDAQARKATEGLLRDCQYEVMSCDSAAAAHAQLTYPGASYDVVLAEATIATRAEAECSAIVELLKELPLILMSDEGKANDIVKGIKIGAVDFLEKPLCALKLRNIWQHTVRKMMKDMELVSHDAKDSGSEGANGEKGSARAVLRTASISSVAEQLPDEKDDAPDIRSNASSDSPSASSQTSAQMSPAASGPLAGLSSPAPSAAPSSSTASGSCATTSSLSSKRKPKELLSANVSNRPPLAIKPIPVSVQHRPGMGLWPVPLPTPMPAPMPPPAGAVVSGTNGSSPDVVMGTPVLSQGPGQLQPPIVGPGPHPMFYPPHVPVPPHMLPGMGHLMWPGMMTGGATPTPFPPGLLVPGTGMALPATSLATQAGASRQLAGTVPVPVQQPSVAAAAAAAAAAVAATETPAAAELPAGTSGAAGDGNSGGEDSGDVGLLFGEPDALLAALPPPCSDLDSSLEHALSSEVRGKQDADSLDTDWLFDELCTSPVTHSILEDENPPMSPLAPIGLELKKTPSFMEMISECLLGGAEAAGQSTARLSPETLAC